MSTTHRQQDCHSAHWRGEQLSGASAPSALISDWLVDCKQRANLCHWLPPDIGAWSVCAPIHRRGATRSLPAFRVVRSEGCSNGAGDGPLLRLTKVQPGWCTHSISFARCGKWPATLARSSSATGCICLFGTSAVIVSCACRRGHRAAFLSIEQATETVSRRRRPPTQRSLTRARRAQICIFAKLHSCTCWLATVWSMPPIFP